MVKMALSLPLYLQPWRDEHKNNFIDDSASCYMKNQMLATVILVHGLNEK